MSHFRPASVVNLIENQHLESPSEISNVIWPAPQVEPLFRYTGGARPRLARSDHSVDLVADWDIAVRLYKVMPGFNLLYDVDALGGLENTRGFFALQLFLEPFAQIVAAVESLRPLLRVPKMLVLVSQ